MLNDKKKKTIDQFDKINWELQIIINEEATLLIIWSS